MMKNKVLFWCAALASAFCQLPLMAAPMGTAFSYQGRLYDASQPANNVYDLTFTLHDNPVNAAAIGSPMTLLAVPVTNGLFTVQLNANGEFGPSAFDGSARWLQMGVRTNGQVNFTSLSPR